MSSGTPIKAAQYVRMSTEKQVYSTDNQMAAIANYALLHQFEIVRTYADEGRSGLRLKGRTALQAMLRDVLSGAPGFQAILVFDVSRWGRFQDTDESAHYEFICRSAGAPVHYCAELFQNDGSLASTVMKNLRRAMAGEFSRDLSAKVWAGQSRLVSLGYKMGGTAGYGLKRLLVDSEGRPKQLLEEGEHKSITTDRVVLVPGDDAEVATVKRIFRLAGEGQSNPEIARILNADGVPAPKADQWSNVQVRQIVISERYLGVYVYNKTSRKLGGRLALNPQSEWIRSEQAFEPLISEPRFKAAQSKARQARSNYTDDELLDHLRRLRAENGYLTSELIEDAAPPASKTYNNRFGSLARAYAKIGYQGAARRPTKAQMLAHIGLASDIQKELMSRGHRVRQMQIANCLAVNETSVLEAQICDLKLSGRQKFWRIKRPMMPDVQMVLAALIRDGVREHLCLVPVTKFGKSGKVEISDGPNRMAEFEIWSLDLLAEMIAWLAPRTTE